MSEDNYFELGVCYLVMMIAVIAGMAKNTDKFEKKELLRISRDLDLHSLDWKQIRSIARRIKRDFDKNACFLFLLSVDFQHVDQQVAEWDIEHGKSDDYITPPEMYTWPYTSRIRKKGVPLRDIFNLYRSSG